jgi:hypothetical protein
LVNALPSKESDLPVLLQRKAEAEFVDEGRLDRPVEAGGQLSCWCWCIRAEGDGQRLDGVGGEVLVGVAAPEQKLLVGTEVLVGPDVELVGVLAGVWLT